MEWVMSELSDQLRAIQENGSTIGDRLSQIEGRLDNNVEHRMVSLEQQMGTMNAHLENIARESAKTSDILGRDFDWRKEQADKEQAKADNAEQRQHELEVDRRLTRRRVWSEFWDVVKQPIANAVAMLVAAGAAFLIWEYLGVDATSNPVEVLPR